MKKLFINRHDLISTYLQLKLNFKIKIEAMIKSYHKHSLKNYQKIIYTNFPN